MQRRLLAAALASPVLLGLAACEASRPAAATRSETLVVFFTEDSAALNESGLAILRGAADAAKANPRAPVAVLGFAGAAGSVGFNQALSDARARHVADHLVEYGVERSRIAIRPRGPVPFELIPTESRRVEIRIGA
jgi:outer membrane protein OmpA-like peptidoglycan-associated protein